MATEAPARKNHQKSYLAKNGELTPEWHVIDANDQVVGRLAARVAMILQGKHKPTYTPHVDTGDFVIITNAASCRVTGAKEQQRTYDTYSGYAGGRRVYSMADMRTRAPHKIIELAVRRMLPKTKLGKQMLTKLKIYPGGEHPHAAQQPKPLDLKL